MFYWQYELIVLEYDDDGIAKLVPRQGVVVGKDIVDVITELNSFYTIEEIKELQAITDTVFDFDEAQENEDFHFKITKK